MAENNENITEQSNGESSDTVSISALYPDLTPADQEEAEYYLSRYLDLIERIYERING